MQLQMHSQMAGLASCLSVKWKSQHSTHFRTLMFVLAKLLLLLLLQQLLLLLLRNPVQVELVWKSLAPKDGFPIWRHHKFCSREKETCLALDAHTHNTQDTIAIASCLLQHNSVCCWCGFCRPLNWNGTDRSEAFIRIEWNQIKLSQEFRFAKLFELRDVSCEIKINHNQTNRQTTMVSSMVSIFHATKTPKSGLAHK